MPSYSRTLTRPGLTWGPVVGRVRRAIAGGCSPSRWPAARPSRRGPREWREKLEGRRGARRACRSSPARGAPTGRSLPGRVRPVGHCATRPGATTPTCRSWPPASHRSRRSRCCRTRGPPRRRAGHRPGPARAARWTRARDDGARRRDRGRRVQRPGALPRVRRRPARLRLRHHRRRQPGAAPGSGRGANRSSPGIPRGARDNGGALAADGRGALLVATGSAGLPPDAGSLAGSSCDRHARPAGRGNPGPGVADLQLRPARSGRVCARAARSGSPTIPGSQDVLYRAVPGALGDPAWTWPDRPGVAGCVAQPGLLLVAQTTARSVYVLRPDENGTFTGAPETLPARTVRAARRQRRRRRTGCCGWAPRTRARADAWCPATTA